MNLATPSATMAIIQKYGLRLSKHRGQNFLVDGNIVNRIVAAAQLTADDVVLEVGPGIGTLTQQLARNAGTVLAIEIDTQLLPVLADTLAEQHNVCIVQGDFLKVDLAKIIKERLVNPPNKIVTNLPYSVSAPVLIKLVNDCQWELAIIMLQQEVADRLLASPGSKNYSSITIAVNYWCEPQLVMRVPPSVFIPRPQVSSTVVRLVARPEPLIKVAEPKYFWQVVRASFGRRRKTLLNALSALPLGLSRPEIENVLIQANIDHGRRGETLSIEEFGRIADSYCRSAKSREEGS